MEEAERKRKEDEDRQKMEQERITQETEERKKAEEDRLRQEEEIQRNQQDEEIKEDTENQELEQQVLFFRYFLFPNFFCSLCQESNINSSEVETATKSQLQSVDDFNLQYGVKSNDTFMHGVKSYETSTMRLASLT